MVIARYYMVCAISTGLPAQVADTAVPSYDPTPYTRPPNG